MREPIIGLFAEDRGHAAFVEALVRRIGREKGQSLDLRVIAGHGGHGRALDEFKVYQRSMIRSITEVPSVVVVVIDANCSGWNKARVTVQNAVDPAFAPNVVVGCPDPHVERWYLADPDSFHQVVGASVPRERIKCKRDYYKNRLKEAVRRGGHIPTLGGIEFAREIVDAMNLYRAGQGEPSLQAFVNDAKKAIRQLGLGKPRA